MSETHSLKCTLQIDKMENCLGVLSNLKSKKTGAKLKDLLKNREKQISSKKFGIHGIFRNPDGLNEEQRNAILSKYNTTSMNYDKRGGESYSGAKPNFKDKLDSNIFMSMNPTDMRNIVPGSDVKIIAALPPEIVKNYFGVLDMNEFLYFGVVKTYKVDSNGQFELDENGNKIITTTFVSTIHNYDKKSGMRDFHQNGLREFMAELFSEYAKSLVDGFTEGVKGNVDKLVSALNKYRNIYNEKSDEKITIDEIEGGDNFSIEDGINDSDINKKLASTGHECAKSFKIIYYYKYHIKESAINEEIATKSPSPAQQDQMGFLQQANTSSPFNFEIIRK